MKLFNSLFAVFLITTLWLQAQLENLPQTFEPLDVSHFNAYYPGPHGNYFPQNSDQVAEVRQRYLYLGPLGVRGLAHVPEYMRYNASRAATNPALRSSNGAIEIPYYEVLGVDPKAPAANYLREGDLIVGVDGKSLRSGIDYNPANRYATKYARNLSDCLGDAIDKAEGRGLITFQVMRLPNNLPTSTSIPDQISELHRTNLVDDYEERNIEVNVTDGDKIWLIAEDAGDGNGFDHSYWLDARWVKADGTEEYMQNGEWIDISVGYGSSKWGTSINYSAGTTTRSLFAHASSTVSLIAPEGVSKFRVTLKNNSTGSIIGAIRSQPKTANFGSLQAYVTDVTIPVAKIGSYLAGGAEREHKLEQMISSQAAWLLNEQRADGGWSSLGSYTSDVWDTSYIGLAMLAAGEPRFDEAAKRAAYYIVENGQVTDWSSPRGITLTFLAEYYLRTGDAGILPGLQDAVRMVEENLFAQGYIGHKINYGYGTGGQNSGFSYMLMGLSAASRTPAKVDQNLLRIMLERMDAMTVNGTMPYGRSWTVRRDTNAGAVDAVAMTGPCVAANSITGASQRFHNTALAAMQRSVGGLDFGHSTQSYGLFGGTLSTINLDQTLYLRHQELTMPKMILQRCYTGGVAVSEIRTEYMGAEGFFRPRMATAIQILTLAAGRKNLAITGNPTFQATMKPGRDTHIWDLETQRFWLRGWAVAIELLGDDAPASLYTGYNALKNINRNGPLFDLHDQIYSNLETYALNAVGDINALTGISAELKADAIESILGMELTVNVTEKAAGLADVKLSAYWPLRERNRWADSATQNAWKTNANFLTSGSISIANGSALNTSVNISFNSSTASTDWTQGYSGNLGTIEVTRLDDTTSFTLPVQISYTVGGHSISYTRDATFEAGLGGSFEDTHYITIPSCRVMRKTKGDELVVEMERTGEYLQMHGNLLTTFQQGEKVSLEFKQLNLALGGHRNATSLGSPLTWYDGTSFSATPGATTTAADISNMLDGNTSTSSRAQSSQRWAGFEMDLGTPRLINGILIVDAGYNVYKVEAEINGVWTHLLSGGFIQNFDYFDTQVIQKLRIYWPVSSSGYTPSINNIRTFYNPYGHQDTNVAQNRGDGVTTAWKLWQDRFDNLSAGTISALKADANYPNTPSASGPLFVADSGDNIGDNYGQRWTGWITPDESGSFTFYAAADAQVELYLSTDEHPANKALIASKYTPTSPRDWSASAISSPVTLIAGKRYYIELLHAAGSGGDNCALAWQKPSNSNPPANGSTGISDSYFTSIAGGVAPNTGYVFPAITAQPSSLIATAAQPATFSVTAGGSGSLSYQWMKNGIALSGANTASYSITSASAADAGSYTCLIRNEYGQILSQAATLSFANQAPSVTPDTFTIAENASPFSSVGTVTATDPESTTLQYSITKGNIDNAFAINPTTGEITTAKALDYEYVNSYRLEITATDDGIPAISGSALIQVNITNIFEVAPTLQDREVFTASGAAAPAYVADMSAADPELKDGDSITYSITGGNTGGAFSINPSTGVVTTAAVLDHTVTPFYTLQISATDSAGFSDIAELRVLVRKEVVIAWNFTANDPTSKVEQSGTLFDTSLWTDSVNSASPAGTQAPSSTSSWAVTTPRNAPMVTVNWSSANLFRSGNTTTLTDKLFRNYLDDSGTTGPKITVSGLSQWLNNNAVTSYSITFFQSSDASNNNFPSINIYDGSTTSGTLLENMPTTLTDGSGSGSGSRLMRTTTNRFNNDTITFHTQRNLDGGNRASFSAFKITAAIEETNIAPIIEDTTVAVSDRASIGAFVAELQAIDINSNASLNYSILSGNTGNAFSISSTGIIQVAAALSHATQSQYNLVVQVTDNGGLSTNATVTVNIIDGKDSDQDGLNDAWEIAHFGTTSYAITNEDSDGDSFSNFKEFAFGINPLQHNNEQDYFLSEETKVNGSTHLKVSFRRPKDHANLGLTHHLLESSDLTNWSQASNPPTATVTDAGDGSTEWVIYSIPTTSTPKFYKISANPAP